MPFLDPLNFTGTMVPAYKHSGGGRYPRWTPLKPSLFVIHYSESTSFANLVNYLATVPNVGDSNWCVGQNSEVTTMVPPEQVPYTNGWGVLPHSSGKVVLDSNPISLTVETTNNIVASPEYGGGNFIEYTDVHYTALARLFSLTRLNFPTIQLWDICGHEHLSTWEKVDPGPLFDWHRFLVTFCGMTESFYTANMRLLGITSRWTAKKIPNYLNRLTYEQHLTKQRLCVAHFNRLNALRNNPRAAKWADASTNPLNLTWN